MIETAVQRVRREDEADIARFLAGRPYENVLLEWLIEHDRSIATRQRLFLSRDAGGAVAGVAHFGRQVVLAAQSSQAVQALANAAYAYRNERMIVAERSVARQYWEAVRAWHAPPRLVRERQPLLAVNRTGLVAVDAGALEIRLARPDETDLVMENSAAMIESELGYDPRRASSSFRWNVRRMIERELWWIAQDWDGPAFFCHVGPYTAHTVQLQGVWTKPGARRRGIAAKALSHICATLFREYPTVSLYVNDFNTAALGLYAHLGFQEAGELSTYLF